MIGQMLRQYLIVERIGSGGMGVVWKARDTSLDRDVALKVLPADEYGTLARKERFSREAKAASALNHPNIITIYEINSAEGVDFIAMELVRGETLAALLQRGAMPVEHALAYGIQIAGAVGRAHAAGIVHRDLKPGNIMVTEDGLIKILDFGLAKVMDSSEQAANLDTRQALTQAGTTLGTLGYMSPEQALGARVDARSDVFAAGVILYEMLTGVLPFSAQTAAEVMHRLHFAEPRSIQSLRPQVPSGVAAAISRSLAKKPEDRYATLSEFAAALKGSTGGVAGEGRPALQGTARRFRRYSTWGLGVMSVVVVIALILFGLRDSAPPADQPQPTGVRPQSEAAEPYELTREAAALLARQDKEGNVDRALALLDRALTQDKTSALAHALLSDAYLRKHQTNPDGQWLRQSREAAEQARHLNPDLAAAWQAMGFVQLQSGERVEAERTFRKAAELDPVNPLPHIGLGRTLLAQGEEKEAEAAFQHAVELGPDEWRTHGELAQLYFGSARYNDAIREWEASRRLTPDNVLILRNLGAAYYLAGRPEEAASILQRALEVRPSASTYTNLGTIRFFQGRYADAVAAFEKAVELGANNYQFWGNLGDGYRWTPGRRAEATTAYRRASDLINQQIAQKPQDADLRTRHAVYLAKMGQRAAALDEIGRAERQPHLTAQMLYRICVVHELAGNRLDALKALDRALNAGYPLQEVQKEPELVGLRADARYHRLVDDHTSRTTSVRPTK